MARAVLSPDSEDALREAVADAAAEGRTLEITGAATKRGLGRPMTTAAELSLARLSGITFYEPGELVMEALAGTPLAEIEEELARHGQRLAFEPPDAGPLFGAEAGRGTIGGVFACNLSGPRRPFAGAARDHLLGVRAVSGRGEVFAAGGRVVKNVTGYDMGKLLAGAFGTLAALTRVTFKVLPRPEAERTVLLFGEVPHEGLGALALAAAEPWEISAGAHLDAAAAARSRVRHVARTGNPVTVVRLEGARSAVAERSDALRRELGEIAPTEELLTEDSRALWAEVRDGALLPATDGGMLWRLSLPPADAAFALDRLAAVTGGELLFDWLGGLVWLAVRKLDPGETPRGLAERVRAAAAHGGGHATLWRAAEEVRARIPVFTPEGEALAALTRRIKKNFDPCGILNPGRMYEGL